MKFCLHKLLSFACVLLTFSGGAYALTLPTPRNLSTSEGLGSNTVYSVIQDNRGFILAATKSGLSRFDGLRFKQYNVSGPAFALLCGNDGKVWIGCESGLWTYDGEKDAADRFTKETEWDVDIASRVTSLAFSRSGRLLIGTFGQGLFIYDSEKDSLSQTSLHASMISRIFQTEKGTFLIGAEEGLVIEMTENGEYLRTLSERKVTADIRNTVISSLFQKKGETFAGFGKKGLYSITGPHAPVEVTQGNGTGSVSAVSFLDISPDVTLLGTEFGIYELSYDEGKRTVRPVLDKYGELFLGDECVNAVFRDKEGGLWIGTQNNGLWYCSSSNKNFSSFLSSEKSFSGKNEIITCFSKAPDGTIWVGSEAGHLYSIGEGKKPVREDVLFPDIKCLWTDNEEIYIGTSTEGVFIYNPSNGSKRSVGHERYNGNSLSDNYINCIFKDSGGRMYVGTRWGLDYYYPETGQFAHERRSSNKADVSVVFEDSHHNVWICTHNMGIFRMNLNGKEWRRIFLDGNPDFRNWIDVNGVMEDSSGRLWFATSSGILCYDYSIKKLFKPSFYKEEPEAVMAVEQDNSGRLWASYSTGLRCMDINGGGRDNLYVTGNNYTEGASVRSGDGELLFGGNKGYSAFYPDDFRDNDYSAPLYITALKVNNEDFHARKDSVSNPVFSSDKIRLKSTENNIEVTYALLSYQNPEKNRYTTFLEGYDKKWSDYSTLPSATYNHLKPGRYVFHVKGIGNDGTEGLSEKKIEIVISRPPLLSTAAKLSYIAAALLILYFLYRELKRRRDLKSVQTRIDFMTNLTHEIRTPVTLIKAPVDKLLSSGDGTPQTKNLLKLVSRSVDNLMDLVNESLDYRKAESGNYTLELNPCDINSVAEDTVSRFRLLAESSGKSISFERPSSPSWYSLDYEVIAKILNNLLSNAVKYADSQVSVNLSCEDAGFTVIVSDDGRSIPKSEEKKIFKAFYQSPGSKSGTGIGLSLAKILAQQHSGSLDVMDTGGKGASFRFGVQTPRIKEPETEVQSVTKADDPVQESALATKYAILIVDDNTDLRLMIVEILKDEYEIYQASDGEQALNVLKEVAVDMIISDVKMDGMDGMTLLRKVKKDKRFLHIPFILLTARSSTEDKIEGAESGADGYITKPFSPDLLKAEIKSTFGNRRRLQEFYSSLPVVHPRKISTITKDSMDFIEKLNACLTENLSDNEFKIEDAAQKLFMSQSSFYRKVKSVLGLSPNEYIKQFRLQKAAEMLSHGDLTVNEVCFKTGFSSVSYFSSCFKKKYGVSPTDYFASLRKEAEG